MTETAQQKHRNARIRFWRRVHLWSGLIAGIWLALIAVTGIALNHAEELGLFDETIANYWLPAGYTDEFHPELTMASTVVADLHSGRFFGEAGRWLGDLSGVALLVSICTGGYVYLVLLNRRPKREQ